LQVGPTNKMRMISASKMEQSFVPHGTSIRLVQPPRHRPRFVIGHVFAAKHDGIAVRIPYAPAARNTDWPDDIAVLHYPLGSGFWSIILE
jgi:hypothetical protein